MRKVLQNIRYGLRTFLVNRPFLAIAIPTVVLGIAANAALLSVVKSYAQPEGLASGVVAALTLARVLFCVWFGIQAIC